MPVFEQPPRTESLELREYLVRTNAQIAHELVNSNQNPRYTDLPDKVSIGKQYYFLNAVPAHLVITAEGLYLYKSTGWVLIA